MVEQILENIDVKPPYFALSNLSLVEGGIRAELSAEQLMYDEMGYMAAAEAGRHLAILGSCALADTNPKKEKHYYLAHKAKFVVHAEDQNMDEPGLYAIASATGFTGRQGDARTIMYDSTDKAIATLETSYHVIEAPIFSELFAAHAVEREKVPDNPYIEMFELDDLSSVDGKLSTKLGPIAAAQCNGHFDAIPCLPVAILMHALCRSSGLLLSEMLGQDTRHVVVAADVSAQNLAFPGDVVHIGVSHLGEDDGKHRFLSEATDGEGKVFGTLTLTVQPAGA